MGFGWPTCQRYRNDPVPRIAGVSKMKITASRAAILNLLRSGGFEASIGGTIGTKWFELVSTALSLRNLPVLRVIPRLRPQPRGSVTLQVSFFWRDALQDNPFSLCVNEVFTRNNESVASYAFLGLFQTRSSGNPERVITVTSF